MIEIAIERGETSDETTIAVTGTPVVVVARSWFSPLLSLYRRLDHLFIALS